VFSWRSEEIDDEQTDDVVLQQIRVVSVSHSDGVDDGVRGCRSGGDVADVDGRGQWSSIGVSHC